MDTLTDILKTTGIPATEPVRGFSPKLKAQSNDADCECNCDCVCDNCDGGWGACDCNCDCPDD